MGFAKFAIDGNDFVGAFGRATDGFLLMGNNVSEGKKQAMEEILGVRAFRISIFGSYLVGIYVAANSRGILLPDFTSDSEIEALRRALPSVRVDVLDGDLNALGNNILANDRIAFVNPRFSKNQVAKIREVLGVEVFQTSTGGFDTIGANNIMTNKGIVFNNRIEDDEKDEIERFSGLKGEQSTANFGYVSIGICSIANSSGTIAGQATTGIEAARIASNLGF